MNAAAAAALAFFTTFFLIRLFVPVARRIGLVDEPGERKIHATPIPLVGGVAIVIGWMLGLIALDESLGPYRSLFAGVVLTFITGLLDDLHELSTGSRFAAQIAAALLMVFWGGIVLLDFGYLAGPFVLNLGWLAVPLTIVCAVGVMNALNMSDGMDGLAATLVLICLGGMALLTSINGGASVLLLIALLAASVLAFWLHNMRWREGRPARVFLGDAGSLTLGFALSWLLINQSQGAGSAFAPVTALWLLAAPLADAVFVLIHRAANGRSPVAGGRDHLHHLFLRAGFPVRTTWLLCTVLALTCASFGVLTELAGVPEYVRFGAFLVFAVGYYRLVARAWTNGLWLGRPVAG